MPALLALIPWRLVGAAALVLLVAAGAWWLQHTIRSLESENATLRASLATAEATSRANAEKVEAIRLSAERDLRAVNDSLEAARIARAQLASKKGALKNVPVAEDEAAAAVLRRALECVSMRDPAACGADHRGGEGESTGSAAGAGR